MAVSLSAAIDWNYADQNHFSKLLWKTILALKVQPDIYLNVGYCSCYLQL